LLLAGSALRPAPRHRLVPQRLWPWPRTAGRGPWAAGGRPRSRGPYPRRPRI